MWRIKKIHILNRKGARYVFALLELDGKCRNKVLGITEELYGNQEKQNNGMNTL